jgi:Fe2+ transport system protein FeoA
VTRLHNLDFGETAVIQDFLSDNLDSLNPDDHEAAVTMMKMGVVPGAHVRLIARGIGGDPLAVEIRGALIAIGRREAALVSINKESAK